MLPGVLLSQAQMAEAADAAGDNLAQFFATATADDSPSKQPAQGADAEEAGTPTVRPNVFFCAALLCTHMRKPAIGRSRTKLTQRRRLR